MDVLSADSTTCVSFSMWNAYGLHDVSGKVIYILLFFLLLRIIVIYIRTSHFHWMPAKLSMEWFRMRPFAKSPWGTEMALPMPLNAVCTLVGRIPQQSSQEGHKTSQGRKTQTREKYGAGK